MEEIWELGFSTGASIIARRIQGKEEILWFCQYDEAMRADRHAIIILMRRCKRDGESSAESGRFDTFECLRAEPFIITT